MGGKWGREDGQVSGRSVQQYILTIAVEKNTKESMWCLPSLCLALHRADVCSLAWRYALSGNYKNMNVGLQVPSRQHEARSSPMCALLLPTRT